MSITRNYVSDLAAGDAPAEEDTETVRESERSTPDEGARRAAYDELLAKKHPEESVDAYLARLGEAARAIELGPDGPAAPTPRSDGLASAPSEYVSGASDADWGYPIEEEE